METRVARRPVPVERFSLTISEDALEVGEQHFDLLPSATALKEGIRFRHGTHLVADGFMWMAGDLSSFLVRRALRL